jgi:hypothetical protein
MRSVLTSTTKKLQETCVLMTEKFGIPRHALASRPAPKRIYKRRRGLNDIQSCQSVAMDAVSASVRPSSGEFDLRRKCAA